MTMEHLKEALDFAKKQGMAYVASHPDWNGKPMCLLIPKDSDNEDIGYPNYCIYEGGEWRTLQTGFNSECLDYMNYVDEKYGFDEEGYPTGFEVKEFRV